jgi:hypothetical protein
MGDISKNLHRRLERQSNKLPTRVPKRRPGEPLPGGGGGPDIDTLIKQGFNPVHAVYTYIQQLSSHFAGWPRFLQPGSTGTTLVRAASEPDCVTVNLAYRQRGNHQRRQTEKVRKRHIVDQ